jgi:hypothetical protein
MTIIKRPMRILVLFTVVSFEEGDGSYIAALAGHALRPGRHGLYHHLSLVTRKCWSAIGAG